MPIDHEKFHGYADAFSEAGLDINNVPMVQADPWDRNAARIMLDAAPNVTAILSMSVMQAIALIKEGPPPGPVCATRSFGGWLQRYSGC